jgi:hypothetical protein
LASLQAIYQELLANIAAAEAASGPNYNVGGVSVDRVGYLNGLYARLAQLQKIPGVAQTPIFTASSVAR